ncbi:RT17 protein, partial [Atractosteus spatula]|nr:RT17 protein [Atractosteus spatula]
MSAKQASVHARWIIGKVIGTKMQKTAKVRVTRLVLDRYLMKVNIIYLNRFDFGDNYRKKSDVYKIKILKALPEKKSKHVKHELAEVVYKVGKVVDPLTGKQVAGSLFLEPLSDSTETTAESLTEKLQELNITAASSKTPEKSSEV